MARDKRPPLRPALRSSLRTPLPPGTGTYAPPHNVGPSESPSRKQVEDSRDDVDRGPNAPLSHLNKPPFEDGDSSSSPDLVPVLPATSATKQALERPIPLRASRDRPKLSFSELGPPRIVRNKTQVLHHVSALIAAFEEVEEHEPARHHNRPPPALWVDDSNYLRDVKSLLGELRELNSLLRALVDKEPAKAEKAANLVAVGTKKFVEEYAGAMGKGAAALTTAAVGALLYHIGVGKEIVDPIWAHLPIGK